MSHKEKRRRTVVDALREGIKKARPPKSAGQALPTKTLIPAHLPTVSS